MLNAHSLISESYFMIIGDSRIFPILATETNTIHKGKALGRRGRDRMVVGYTTTYVISAYHN
jgi:hypothetical protein